MSFGNGPAKGNGKHRPHVRSSRCGARVRYGHDRATDGWEAICIEKKGHAGYHRANVPDSKVMYWADWFAALGKEGG